MKVSTILFIVLVGAAIIGAWLGYKPVNPDADKVPVETQATAPSLPAVDPNASKSIKEDAEKKKAVAKVAAFLSKGGMQKIEQAHKVQKSANPFDDTIDDWKNQVALRGYQNAIDYLSPYLPHNRPGKAVLIVLTVNRGSGGRDARDVEFLRQSKRFLLTNPEQGLIVIRDALQKMPVHDENTADRSQLTRLAEFIIFNSSNSNPDIEEIYEDIKRYTQ
jgi:hypothetical protein